MLTSRQRVKMALDHKEADRVPVYDAPWGSTVERWRQEGLPDDVQIEDYFEYDIRVFLPDTTLHFPYQIIEETEEFIIERNNFGETVKNLKNRSTTPQVLDTPIKHRADWEREKHRLRLCSSRSLSADTALNFSKTIPFDEGLEIFRTQDEREKYLVFGAFVGFDLVQRYVGTERLLVAIVDEPDWVREMFFLSAQFVLEMFEYMEEMGYRFDAVWIFDDLGYRNASLISPRHYRDLIQDGDRLVCEFFHRRGMKVLLHSCGCVKELVPYFIEAGIDCLQPLEVKAGMDLVELKRNYGNALSFMGGIDTRLYAAEDPSLIEDEIKTKITVGKKGGGYIYHCDHSVPHNVSFSQYRKVIEYVNKYGRY